jgi:hypothetical protein
VATVDGLGNATYELVQPAAWDEIIVSAEVLEAVAKAGAFIFGSLATRSPYNLEQRRRGWAVQQARYALLAPPSGRHGANQLSAR